MSNLTRSPNSYVVAIGKSGLTIYDPIEIGSKLYIPSPELEILLNKGLCGFSTAGMPQRTRSQAVKLKICEILGYPAPASFRKTKPRFPGKNFDSHTQKSNNLQIYNEEPSPTIDLGLVTPDSIEPLDIPQVSVVQVRHCDVRYALFDAITNGTTVTIRGFYLSTGKDFFARFTKFQGLVVNRKRQIRLPRNLFEPESLSNMLLDSARQLTFVCQRELA